MQQRVATAGAITPAMAGSTAILGFICASHFLNDVIQSLVPAIYPMLKDQLRLDFSQVGLITFTFQFCASLLQPLIGLVADKRPMPYSLALGMGVTLAGLLVLASAHAFGLVLMAAGMIGIGSSIFHPEASRVARMASGGRLGMAQSVFQVGGYAGSATGPLLAAFIVLPYGQPSISWFTLVALLAMALLVHVGRWYARQNQAVHARRKGARATVDLPIRQIQVAIVVLIVLIVSKYVYTASLSTYLTFYLIDRFGVSIETSQMVLFAYLATQAVGTILGGPLGDRFGRKYVIWGSILGALPLTLALPYVGFWSSVGLVMVIGLVMSSAFPAIIVYAQELVPGRVGMIAGLFFGLAFGISGIGAAALGWLADATSIGFVYKLCGFMPAIGLLTAFLPNLAKIEVR